MEIVEPDPEWARRGEREASALDDLLAAWRTAPVEHVGSTAVPGLPAKPIIDLQAAVRDLTCAHAVADALIPHGWHAVPAELDRRQWRRFLVRVVAGRRASHLHLLLADSDRWHGQLAFRDVLRSDPALCAGYAALKRDLALRHPTDREAYSRAKDDFVRRVIESGERPSRPPSQG